MEEGKKERLLICDGGHLNKEHEAWLLRAIPSEDDAIDAAQLFSQLSSSTRIRLLSMLALDDLCVCELADALKISQPAVSHHLRLLRQSGVVRFKKVGKQVICYISEGRMGMLTRHIINDIFTLRQKEEK
ncbi:MAG TPA: metalloregulator ArsR/SmtB family transcription factor [Clostridia bacterium]|nr:metalloregulator ArsR/SmtB family transcription factor [Clostridia bacterium]